MTMYFNLNLQRFFRYHEHVHNKNIREKKKIRTVGVSGGGGGGGGGGAVNGNQVWPPHILTFNSARNTNLNI